MPQQFYEEEDAAEILRLAAQQQITGGMDWQALLRTAAEVGISAEAVEAAERKLASKRGEVDLAKEFQRRQQSDYIELLLIFGAVDLFLIGLWFVTSRYAFFWPIFPIMGMGLAAILSIPQHLFVGSSGYQASFESWKRKRAKREAKNLNRRE